MGIDSKDIPTPSSPDVSANSGQQERQVRSIPFRELIESYAAQYPRQQKEGIKPTNIHYFGLEMDPNTKKNYPYLGASFDPPLPMTQRAQIGIRRYGINSSEIEELYSYEIKKQPKELKVYNVDAGQILDPSFVEEIDEWDDKVDAAGIQVASDLEEAKKIGSWIVDHELRQRVNGYAEAGYNIFHTLELREAVSKPKREMVHDFFNPSKPDKWVTYDYASIKEIVEEYERGEIDKRLPKPRFSREDLRWMEEHMKAKGMPIPGIS